MNNTAQITNGMLYDLIKELKSDMGRRFEEQQTYMDRRFDIVEDKISTLTVQVSKNTDKIEDLYFHRDKVKITFSRAFAGGIVLFSGVMGYIGALLGIKQ